MSSPPYLAPGDVPPGHARRVLDFLNAAASAREIADAVEIAGELDIGLRLAERILQARTRLGGTFTDLQQLRDIPLIGPERFTEIVRSLSGQALPPDPVAVLRAEVAELRRALAAGVTSAGVRAGRVLALRPVQPHSFLGQPVTVIATVSDDGQPAIDVPVTCVAIPGVLRANDGYGSHQGQLVTARTTIDGTLRFTVQAATTERCSPEQQAALTSLLATLDPAAARPADSDAGLRELARQYAWEVNLPFRQAVDVYVRDYRPALLETVNYGEGVAEWAYHDTAILAFAPALAAPGGAGGSAVTAALHLRARDWIPPFLAAFLAVSREENQLAGELRDLVGSEPDAGRLVTGVYERAEQFLATRHGRVGAYIGKKVAESSIRDLLDQDLAQLPAAARSDVATGLDGASRIMGTAEPAVIGGIVRTRRDLQRDLELHGGAQAGALGDLAGRFDQLEVRVQALPDATAIAQLRGELGTRVTQAELGLALQPLVTRTEFDASLQNVVTKGQLDSSLQGMATKAELNASLQNVATKAELNASMQNVVTKTELNTALAGKVDTATFTGFESTVNQRFTSVNSNITTIRTRIG